MKQKEIVLTRGVLARKGACKRGIEEFKRRYPNGHATLTEVLSDLQELANTSTGYVKYVEYAKWLIRHFPPTQEPLVLNELTDKFIFHNGDVIINSDVNGEYIIIGNGDLNIKGDVNAIGWADIWAYEKIEAGNITADGEAGISAGETIKAINIAAYGHSAIWAYETIDAKKIAAYGYSAIDAGTINTINIAAKDCAQIWTRTINTKNIAAKGRAGISAQEINTQNIMDGDRTRIYGNVNLTQPSSN